MLEAVAWVLWMTLVFMWEACGFLLAVLLVILELAVKLVVLVAHLLRALLRAAIAELRASAAYRAAPRALAVRDYPAPRVAVPRRRVPPRPPRVLR